MSASLKLRVRPLTEDLWPMFEDLFEDGSACKNCWCMYWRIGSKYHRKSASENKNAFREIVSKGPPPGLLAFDGETAIGWCQLTTRQDLAWLNRTTALKPLDDLPVWCISCFYIRKSYRKRGVTSALIREALKIAKKAKAPALEAYPLDAELTSSTSFTGYASTFLRLGFETVISRAPSRPVMRYKFNSPRASAPYQ